jgi:uncharacterized protein (TIGR02246 family)
MDLKSNGIQTRKRPLVPEQFPPAFEAAFNAGDADGVLGLFTENGTMRMTDGSVVSGREALRRKFIELLGARPQLCNKFRAIYVSDEIALALLDWTLTIVLPDGNAHIEAGTATQVLEHGSDGIWRLRISNPLGVHSPVPR